MHLDFMKPEIWNGLVIGTVLIGVSLAVLRIMDDLKVHQRKRDQERKSSVSFLEQYSENQKDSQKDGKNDADTR